MGWTDLVTDYGVPYTVANERNIRVHCPFCGSADKGKHLSLSTIFPFWLCWRDKENQKGKSPIDAISALLHIDKPAAEAIAAKYFPDYKRYSRSVIDKIRAPITPIKTPDDFFSFCPDSESYRWPLEQKFRRYLIERNFDPEFLAARYDIRWAETGPYQNRIIIPTVLDKAWYTWTARSIYTTGLRYKSCEESTVKPDQMLFDYDALFGGDLLILLEGFFDAARITSLLIPNVSAVPLMGKGISDLQLKILMELSMLYTRVVLVLDADAANTSITYWSKFSWYLPLELHIMQHEKDFGDLSPDAARTEVTHIQQKEIT